MPAYIAETPHSPQNVIGHLPHAPRVFQRLRSTRGHAGFTGQLICHLDLDSGVAVQLRGNLLAGEFIAYIGCAYGRQMISSRKITNGGLSKRERWSRMVAGKWISSP